MAAAFFGAAFVRGYSGFGFAALVVSAASLVSDPFLFVPVVLVLDLVLIAQQAPDIRHEVDWRRVAALSVGACLGVPLGVWALLVVGADAARVALSLYILAMCGLLLAGARFARPAGMAAHGGLGVISGLANSAAVGGLPVVVFFAAQPIAAAAFRATLIAYFSFLDLLTIPALWAAGLFGKDTLIGALAALPMVVAGIWAGTRAFRRGNPQGFRRLAIGLLAFLAILGLLRGLW